MPICAFPGKTGFGMAVALRDCGKSVRIGGAATADSINAQQEQWAGAKTPGLEADKDLISGAEWSQQDIQEASDWPLNSHLT